MTRIKKMLSHYRVWNSSSISTIPASGCKIKKGAEILFSQNLMIPFVTRRRSEILQHGSMYAKTVALNTVNKNISPAILTVIHIKYLQLVLCPWNTISTLSCGLATSLSFNDVKLGGVDWMMRRKIVIVYKIVGC
jgi:hypothetical protein